MRRHHAYEFMRVLLATRALFARAGDERRAISQRRAALTHAPPRAAAERGTQRFLERETLPFVFKVTTRRAHLW